jgi:hypothetical protein
MAVGKIDSYNKYKTTKRMGYNIISFLISNNEDMWKLLKYNKPNALSQPNLTQSEKLALIYRGEEQVRPFRVFRQWQLDDAFSEECTILKVYLSEIDPVDKFDGIASFCIDILTHSKVQTLDTGDNRIEVIFQQIIETLNGVNVGGIGQLFFDKKGSRNNRASLSLSNNRNYSGMNITMSTWVKEGVEING